MEPTESAARPHPAKGSIDIVRTRLGAALAAPTAALILIPLLVIATGLFVSFTCRRAHDRSIKELARARFQDHGIMLGRRVEETLRQAGPLLDDLRDYLSRDGLKDPPAVFTHRLNVLMRELPAVAYLFVGEVNGNMRGTYREKDGRVFATWRDRERHLLRNWDALDESMKLTREDANFMYDARVRPWYVKALERKARVWTAPYVFFDQGVAGIGCSEPLSDANGQLLGVIAVEFNLNTLSGALEKLSIDNTVQCFVFSSRRQLLAFPGYHSVEGQNRSAQGELPLITDVHDLAAQALTMKLPAVIDEPLSIDFTVDEQPFLGSVSPVDFGADAKWFVATWGSLSGLQEPAIGAWHRSLIVVVCALLVAVLASVLFARHLIRNQRRVVKAEQRAEQAVDEARQLGSYRLIRKLGEGGMGQVWLAEHRLLSRPVAVKLIKTEQLSADDLANVQSRFRREARTMARLESPHTIAIYDFGIGSDGSLFYVMELLYGLDLDALIGRFGTPPLGRSISILLQAASSLAEAHSHGLIHRDVKPANIYLCRKADELDHVKVLDFGLVHEHNFQETRLTQQGALYGTPAYIAPEQAQDSSTVDARADLYSLACVAYVLITGREVFLGTTPMAMVMAHVSQPPPPISQLTKRSIPRELEDLLLKCLNKDPEQRPADLHVFQKELAAIPIPVNEQWTDDMRREWWDRSEIQRVELAQTADAGDPTTRWLVPQRS